MWSFIKKSFDGKFLITLLEFYKKLVMVWCMKPRYIILNPVFKMH